MTNFIRMTIRLISRVMISVGLVCTLLFICFSIVSLFSKTALERQLGVLFGIDWSALFALLFVTGDVIFSRTLTLESKS